MRVWLDPRKVAERGLSAGDVVRAIREQNVQAAAGVVGASPSAPDVDLQLSINAQGRLQSEEEFGDIIVKTEANGAVTRLRDVARLELGASEYALRSLLDNKARGRDRRSSPRPTRTRIQISDNVRAHDGRHQEERCPRAWTTRSSYDPTQFVRASIKAVVETLLEAIALVVLVVILFLQTWRASVIPLLAVPVSVDRHVRGAASLRLLDQRAHRSSAWCSRSGSWWTTRSWSWRTSSATSRRGCRRATPPIARCARSPVRSSRSRLVLVAVFVPLAFISGLTGQFYKQFALTIAISTVISAVNSLTLSPALAALLLKGRNDSPKDALTRAMDRYFGWLFRGFNRLFERGAIGYTASPGRRARTQGRDDGRVVAVLALPPSASSRRCRTASCRRRTSST